MQLPISRKAFILTSSPNMSLLFSLKWPLSHAILLEAQKHSLDLLDISLPELHSNYKMLLVFIVKWCHLLIDCSTQNPIPSLIKLPQNLTQPISYVETTNKTSFKR
jgi:hypothetical protein